MRRLLLIFCLCLLPLAAACTPILPTNSDFLACVRNHESHGEYDVVSPSGIYHGAYQFDQTTWDNAALQAGQPNLIGWPAELVDPYHQDLVAQALYEAAGPGPWNGSGC